MPKSLLGVAWVAALALLPTWACPQTKAELEVKEYVDKRTKLLADGSLAKQIQEGTYTADSLSLEMYQWWVQNGLANHAIAIDNFVNMIQDSGMPQQTPPSKAWTPLVDQWVLPLVAIGFVFVNPLVLNMWLSFKVNLLSYRTLALALADPTQGGSSDFLKAAQEWRSHMPNQHTSNLLIVHDFINELKSKDTQRRLLPAYELVTQLINSTQSYRYLFNSYYAAYQQATVPNSEFYLAALVYKDWPWSTPQVTTRTIWNPAPAGLDGCVIVGSMMQANDECIDSSTPGLYNFTTKALLINTVFLDHLGYRTWSAYEFSCDDVSYDSQTGCVDYSGRHFLTLDACPNGRLPMDEQTDVFEELRAACATNSFDAATPVAVNNHVNISGKPDHYFLTKFSSPSYFAEHTCKFVAAANKSIVI